MQYTRPRSCAMTPKAEKIRNKKRVIGIVLQEKKRKFK